MWLESDIGRCGVCVGLILSAIVLFPSCKSSWKTAQKLEEQSTLHEERRAVGHKRITLRYWSNGLEEVPPTIGGLNGDSLALVRPLPVDSKGIVPRQQASYCVELVEEEVQSSAVREEAHTDHIAIDKGVQAPRNHSLLLGLIGLVLTLLLCIVLRSRLTRYLRNKTIY